MPNDLTGNPWVIDTASATPVTTDDVYLDTIRWVGATTAGHQALVKDNKPSPDTLYESLANGANFIDERSFGAEYSGPRRVVGGLAVTTRLQDVHVYVEYTEAAASASRSLMLMGVGR